MRAVAVKIARVTEVTVNVHVPDEWMDADLVAALEDGTPMLDWSSGSVTHDVMGIDEGFAAPGAGVLDEVETYTHSDLPHTRVLSGRRIQIGNRSWRIAGESVQYDDAVHYALNGEAAGIRVWTTHGVEIDVARLAR